MTDAIFLTNWAAAALPMTMPLLLAALGTILAGRAGVLNLGTEGMMMCGALAGAVASLATGSPVAGVAAAILAGAGLALVFGIACLIFKADQVVTGLTLAALGAGITGLLGRDYAQKGVPGFPRLEDHALAHLPGIGPVLFAQDALLYACLPLAALVWWYLARTDGGLKLRAVGEAPDAADAAGVPVTATRMGAVLAGGALSGLAGGYLALAGSRMWIEGMTNGRGWIAIAVVILARWNPVAAIGGALLFGAVDALVPRLQAAGVAVPTFILFMAPYLAALAVLVATAILRRDGAMGPAALGRPYSREDRH
ncbi:ABC transporter permease [Tistrella mobilis]|uniref:ABC transporter permease n=1 Tax=Tistrella mobilis TaxID=171437 RepID=UPI0035565731